MKRFAALLALLALIGVACGQYTTVTPETVGTPTVAKVPPTDEPVTEIAPQMTETVPAKDSQQSAVVRAVVNVRSTPDGEIVGYLLVGDIVTVAECSETWCQITSPTVGYVWRGCLSDNPDALGCGAK